MISPFIIEECIINKRANSPIFIGNICGNTTVIKPFVDVYINVEIKAKVKNEDLRLSNEPFDKQIFIFQSNDMKQFFHKIKCDCGKEHYVIKDEVLSDLLVDAL